LRLNILDIFLVYPYECEVVLCFLVLLPYISLFCVYATEKRKTTIASSSSSYDKKLFISVEAEDRFRNFVTHKGPIKERGFVNPSNKLEAIIKNKGWEEFAK
ncbi:hypothetical protein PanWU01x14_231230, partial [Parasponia andersonii]